MRLVCPNCGAQYEIADGLISPSGRDVQCSSCAHTWREMPPAADEDLQEPSVKGYDWHDEPSDADLAPENRVPEGEPAPRASALDPEVADILRSEAARERAARQADQMQSQPDLGLAPPPPRRVDHTAGQPRRELLPDVEAINNSLRKHTPSPKTPERKSSGFWKGFWIVTLPAALALAIYVLAPQIMQLTPDNVDAWLQSYVAWVDGLRLWLDSKIQSYLLADGIK